MHSLEPSLAASVRFSRSRLFVTLSDGHEISVPLVRFPRLLRATDAQRRKWEIGQTAIPRPDSAITYRRDLSASASR